MCEHIKPFVIKGPVDDGERLYWSSDDGWVDRESATVFDQEVTLPLEATGIALVGGEP